MVSSRSRKRHIRHLRVRKKISGSSDVPRLSVFRSNKNIYVQLINDVTRETLVSCDNKDKEVISFRAQNYRFLKQYNEIIRMEYNLTIYS